MPRDRRLLSLVPLAVVLLALATVACVLPTPLGELPSTTTSGGSESDGATTIGPPPPSMTSETGSTEPPPPHAFAMRYDEWSPTAETAGSGSGASGTGGNTGGTGGDPGSNEPTPDTLVVQLSTGPDDCIDPHAALECGGYWTITLLVPPELQVPGTYDLATELSGLATISGDEEGPTCSFGAGTLEGTGELLEVSPQQVTGHLSPTDAFGLGTDFEFVAPRC